MARAPISETLILGITPNHRIVPAADNHPHIQKGMLSPEIPDPGLPAHTTTRGLHGWEPRRHGRSPGSQAEEGTLTHCSPPPMDRRGYPGPRQYGKLQVETS
ncbi:Hypothetical predicted protein [Pelobates cultripes]|uniref:Uncharacterized protein n=1 Tax=Pelobates cultripes TaxID=61616 RepID=A0AAD1WE60_PELCU|nr:Hypothetical predicted protein [Pelobates cultripes]